jgi:hypothetical protein
MTASSRMPGIVVTTLGIKQGFISISRGAVAGMFAGVLMMLIEIILS